MQIFFARLLRQGKVAQTGEKHRKRPVFPLLCGGERWYTAREADREPLFKEVTIMKKLRKTALVVLAAAALTVNAAGAVRYNVPSAVPAQTQQQGTGTVASLTNAARAQNGLAALNTDSGLDRAAALRAEEIARSFSHTRPSGGSFASALSDSGVTYRSAGENIAYGQSSAAEVVRAWLASPGHRANILSGRYSRIGTASRNVNGTMYWVQVFAD